MIDYEKFMNNPEYKEGMRLFREHIIFLNDYPILVTGDPAIVDFDDKDIYYQDDCMVCGKGNNKKWREFRMERIDGTFCDPEIMTYEAMLESFGEETANYIFEKGEMPDEW